MTKAITAKGVDLPDKKRGTPPMSKQAMYSKIASHGDYLIEKLLTECESKNPSIRLWAIKTLINKVLPELTEADIKSDGEQVFIPLIKLHEIRRNISDSEDSQPNKTD
jgi:hypothetical protein